MKSAQNDSRSLLKPTGNTLAVDFIRSIPTHGPPSQNPLASWSVPVMRSFVKKIAGPSRATLSLRQQHFRAACGLRQEGKGGGG